VNKPEFVDQEFLTDPEKGVEGDCWRACVASITDTAREQVPHFVSVYGDNWFSETNEWLRQRGGYELQCYRPEFPIVDPNTNKTPYLAILVGISPRNVGHAVLGDAYDGTLEHDPHPDRTGLTSVAAAFILTKKEVA
jgi:hypothetical protein